MSETHLVPFDGWPYPDGSLRAICGQVVRGNEITNVDPSCPICRERDDFYHGRSAEDVFGAEAEIREHGPTVQSRYGDPTADYIPKESKR